MMTKIAKICALQVDVAGLSELRPIYPITKQIETKFVPNSQATSVNPEKSVPQIMHVKMTHDTNQEAPC